MAGPVVAGVGLILILIGLISFFASFGSFGGPPKYFWCAFLGMPTLFVGVVMCQAGFIGTVQRYLAGETAPVAADTFNYTADAVRPGVKAVASAIRDGLKEEQAEGAETVEARLLRLDGLRAKGLVTEKEYAEQRQRILADI